MDVYRESKCRHWAEICMCMNMSGVAPIFNAHMKPYKIIAMEISWDCMQICEHVKVLVDKPCPIYIVFIICFDYDSTLTINHHIYNSSSKIFIVSILPLYINLIIFLYIKMRISRFEFDTINILISCFCHYNQIFGDIYISLFSFRWIRFTFEKIVSVLSSKSY